MWPNRLSVALVATAAMSLSTCRSNEILSAVAEAQAEEVTFSQLLASADKLDGSLVRLIAPCNIAFRETRSIRQMPQ